MTHISNFYFPDQVCLLQRTSELEQRLDTVVQALGGVDLLGGLLGAPNDSLPLSHSPGLRAQSELECIK